MTINRTAAVVLRSLVVLLGIGVLAFLIWTPTVEGVNANATSFSQIYLDDPFLAYAYASSILFFVALYQAFVALGNSASSQRVIKALRTIKYCAGTLAVLIIAAAIYLRATVAGNDDPAGAMAMAIFMTVVCVTVAIGANVFERRLK